MRARSVHTYEDYAKVLDQDAHEYQELLDALTINVTKFFRNVETWNALRPYLDALARARPRLRVWSAGCASGEEPYTIAAVLRRSIPDIDRHDVRILATDIDTEVLSKGANGEYPAASIDDVPENYRSLFQPKGSRGTAVAIGDELKSLISFRHLNLMVQPWPMRGLFDAIFCRNVMIYFDGPTKSALIDRFVRQLKPGGWLYIGHSESLLGTHQNLSHAGRTIYRRAM
jgi:chemotaxis protein methyltransferase CheR